jgi:hypothetical protein
MEKVESVAILRERQDSPIEFFLFSLWFRTSRIFPRSKGNQPIEGILPQAAIAGCRLKFGHFRDYVSKSDSRT